MKKLRKKIVALFLTAAMVVSLAPAAFAGSFSDVKADASYAGAVERLAGLGIIAGMGDGTFQPDGTFTRAQAAKIAVMLRGVKNAGTGATEFSDVPATHWASGWINLASGLGIIKGKGNGKFDPEGKVTHAEWLTMVLRVMGYSPVIDKKPWPAGVLAQAAVLGLDNGVNVVANLPASRAEVAVMSDNALTQDIMKVTGFTADGKETYGTVAGDTVAKIYLKAKIGKTTLTNSPDVFGEDKLTVSPAVDTKTSIELVSGTKVSGLLGHEVEVWLNNDGKAYYVQDKTAATNVKTLKIKNSKLQLDGKDITASDIATTVKVFKNRQAQTDQTTVSGLNTAVAGADNDEVTGVLDANGKIAYVIFTVSTTRIVDSVSTAFESMGTKTVGGGSDSLSLKDKTVTWSGAASKLADVQKGDVIQYFTAAVGTKNYVDITVTRNTKTGDLTRIDSAGDKITVGGTQYDEIAGMPDTTGTGNTSGLNTDTGLLGKSVKITLDRFGKVVAVESAVGEATKTIAAMYGDPWSNITGGSPDKYVKVRVIKSDGTEAIYEVAKDATVDADNNSGNGNEITAFDPTANNAEGTLKTTGKVGDKSVIEYTTDSNGKINAITVLYSTAGGGAYTATTNKDNNTVWSDANANETRDSTEPILAVTTATVIFDLSAAKPAVVARDRLMAESDNQTTAAVVRTKSTESLVKAIAITGGLTSAQSDTYGLVMGRYQASGSKYYLSVNVKGTTTDYEVNSAQVTDAAYAADAVVSFQPGDAKATMSAVSKVVDNTDNTDTASAVYVWKVASIDAANKIVYVNKYDATTGVVKTGSTQTGYVFGDKSQAFNLNGENAATYVNFTDLAVGQRVHLYDAQGDGVLEIITID